MTLRWLRVGIRIGALFIIIRTLLARPAPAGTAFLVSLVALLTVGLLEDDYEGKWLAVVAVATLLEAGRLGLDYAVPVLTRLK